MKMVKLNNQYTVMPDQITEVSINERADSITVRLVSGIGHSVMADYGKSIYATHDRLINEINEALQ